MDKFKDFGKYVCSDATLKRYMPAKDYNRYIELKNNHMRLGAELASRLSQAIKEWALDCGATHYTHWFMPLNGKTAEKQVSFVELHDGKAIAEFSAKALIMGETDASSFPNGGMRATFEARGYTVWDYSSPIFIKLDTCGNKVMYIPTAFCSYDGTALDEKTPLLRSLEALNRQSVRVLHMLGVDVHSVNMMAGIEQEYFLVQNADYKARRDIKFVGRTLYGAKPLKDQRMCSHYFGAIDKNVTSVMNEVDHMLWQMGVGAKHQHNEVAPHQYELVPTHTPANIAVDQNQLIMMTIKDVAKKYGLRALFAEKPFDYINGSGKHINMSLCTDSGINLFDSSIDNKNIFYVFFIAAISAVNKYRHLIKLSASHRGNDLRLGGHEAPPTIISIYASDYIVNMLNSINEDIKVPGKKLLNTRVSTLPLINKDYCDRNRTSPFAYTGNKFEFRMVGSSQSAAFPITCFATAMSKVLSDMAEEASTMGGGIDNILKVAKKYYNDNNKIIFNGNCYAKEWFDEAKQRGLTDVEDTLTLYNHINDEDIIKAFESMGVLNADELGLRYHALCANYIDEVQLEARVMIDMMYKSIVPALMRFKDYANNCKIYDDILTDNMCNQIDTYLQNINSKLTNDNIDASGLLQDMHGLRELFDGIEHYIPNDIQPFPSYNEILF